VCLAVEIPIWGLPGRPLTQHEHDRRRSGQRFDVLETWRAEPFFNLTCRPWMASPAYDPQISKRFAERTRRSRMEPEYEPTTWRERPLNVLQRCGRDSRGDKGSGNHARVKIVLSSRSSILCERNSTRPATSLWARFLRARDSAGSHESIPIARSDGQERAASIASRAEPPPD
jgi:hypothetical protein